MRLASSNQIPIMGQFDTTIEWHDKSITTTFLVIHGNQGSLIGSDTAVGLGIMEQSTFDTYHESMNTSDEQHGHRNMNAEKHCDTVKNTVTLFTL